MIVSFLTFFVFSSLLLGTAKSLDDISNMDYFLVIPNFSFEITWIYKS